MKGDNMEMYCVHKLTRDGGNLTMAEFMRPDKAWLPIRNLSSSCLGDKLHHHFQRPFIIEKQINSVIFKLYLWGFTKTHPIWLCFGPEALASWFFPDCTNSSCYLILKEVPLFLQAWSPQWQKARNYKCFNNLLIFSWLSVLPVSTEFP